MDGKKAQTITPPVTSGSNVPGYQVNDAVSGEQSGNLSGISISKSFRDTWELSIIFKPFLMIQVLVPISKGTG